MTFSFIAENGYALHIILECIKKKRMTSPEGIFVDPKHGRCMRVISQKGPMQYIISGVYGTDERKLGSTWSASMQEMPSENADGSTLFKVDFRGKEEITHDRIYYARWHPDTRTIHWQDGNVWFGMMFSRKQFKNLM